MLQDGIGFVQWVHVQAGVRVIQGNAYEVELVNLRLSIKWTLEIDAGTACKVHCLTHSLSLGVGQTET